MTQQSFSRCRKIFSLQIEEAEAQRNLAGEREQWLNTTLRSIGDAVIACDPEGRVVLMNSVAEELTGWTEQGASGRPLPDVFHIVNEYTRAIAENPVEKVRRAHGMSGWRTTPYSFAKMGPNSRSMMPPLPYEAQTGGSSASWWYFEIARNDAVRKWL